MSTVFMAKEQDQSMEEILQSIKRIIAEEGEPAPSGSDVLELTELLSDEAANADLAMQGGNENSVGNVSLDDIMAAPINPVVEPAPAPRPAPVATAPMSQPLPKEEPLVSEQTLASSIAALSALSSIPHSAPPASDLEFRSGTKLEDLVVEAIRPMLREWLDGNLTRIVEGMVEKEIRRLTMR